MTSVEIALTFSLRNTRDIHSRSNSKRLTEDEINNIDLQLIDRHQSTSLCRTNQELRLPAYGVSQKNNDIGQAYFFRPSPFPLSFFRPRTYRKGYYFYSPQSSNVTKSKMAATTILRTRKRFRPPKIRLHCRLIIFRKGKLIITCVILAKLIFFHKNRVFDFLF